MKKMIVSVAVILLAMFSFSGCAGMELGGKLWVSRVDEKQESQRTHNVPLACYLWRKCGARQPEEVEGS